MQKTRFSFAVLLGEERVRDHEPGHGSGCELCHDVAVALADVAYLKSSAGSLLTLNRITQTGTYSFNGVTYPIQEDLPASVQASLAKANAPLPKYGAAPPSNRRSLRRGRRAQLVERAGLSDFQISVSAGLADGNN